jgi:hypothetical protein
VDGKELNEVCLILPSDTLELENLAEVGVGAVPNVAEVGLNQTFGWDGPDLKSFEQRVDARHALIDTLHKASWRLVWRGRRARSRWRGRGVVE